MFQQLHGWGAWRLYANQESGLPMDLAQRTEDGITQLQFNTQTLIDRRLTDQP